MKKIQIILLFYFIATCLANVFQFGTMVKSVTGKNPLKFNNYGCFCGIKNFGNPIDDLDQCCYDHDMCYREVRKSGGSPVMIKYDYQIDDNRKITCLNDENDKNKYETCNCDAIAAHCFLKKEYNPKFKHISLVSRYYHCKKLAAKIKEDKNS